MFIFFGEEIFFSRIISQDSQKFDSSEKHIFLVREIQHLVSSSSSSSSPHSKNDLKNCFSREFLICKRNKIYFMQQMNEKYKEFADFWIFRLPKLTSSMMCTEEE